MNESNVLVDHNVSEPMHFQHLYDGLYLLASDITHFSFLRIIASNVRYRHSALGGALSSADRRGDEIGLARLRFSLRGGVKIMTA